MTTLFVGASGATGRLLVEQLLAQGEQVKVILRSADALSNQLKQNNRLIITEANLLDMTDEELFEQVQGCRAIASCLGHNLTFKGVFGHPRRLVTNAVQRLCNTVQRINSKAPTKFILMNTAGNVNKLAGETLSNKQSFVLALIRHLLPPHIDNEQAAAYLQSKVENNQNLIEWAVVRPDDLIDQASVTEYAIYTSPIRCAIFDAGKTSRINVAHFMSQLIVDGGKWQEWKGHMPVIYNSQGSLSQYS